MICTNHGNIERVFHIELVLFKMRLCKKVNVACKMIAVKDPSFTKKTLYHVQRGVEVAIFSKKSL